MPSEHVSEVQIVTSSPFLIPTVAGRNFVQVDAGERHTCAVDDVGRVWCWGEGDNGRLGLGNTTDRVQPFQVTLPGGATAVQVSAGTLHTCAVTTDGRVFCWGSPLDGRLGDGVVIFDQLTPIQASGIAHAVSVSAGHDHTCARIKDGTTYTDRCWGNNFTGELGDGTDTSRAIGMPISMNCGWTHGANAMSGGVFHSCSTMTGATDDRAMCWGENEYGQLGGGDYEYRLTPWPVAGTTGAQLAGAGATHSCSLTADNRVRCWGDNLSGQLGDNTINFSLTPVLVSDVALYVHVATGSYHSCGITVAGAVKCWGNNGYGQIGDNSLWNRLVPTTVMGLPGPAISISLGHEHSCAVVQNGADRQVYCWGRGLYGQLGHNLPFDSWIAVRAGTINDAYKVAAGRNHTCATTSGGAVWCWGRSESGQLGYNSLSASWVPVQVIDQTNTPIVAPFASIAAGRWHSCVAPIGATQQAACWGDNTYGQLGNGSFLINPRSQVLPSMTFVSSISTGGAHSCAKVSGGITMCWGANDSGQLGDGTLTNRDVPVRVGGACY